MQRIEGRILFRCSKLLGFFLIPVFGAVACVTSFPIEEYNIARVAIESARDYEAARQAPHKWHSASEAYRQGEECYRSRDYKCAKEKFILARRLAEQAEDAARLAAYQSGNAVP